MRFNIEEAARLLELAGVFYYTRAEIEEDKNSDDPEGGLEPFELNLNDTFWWACAYGIKVEEADLPELARLFWLYGWGGILYWAVKKGDIKKIEFLDVRRAVEFVTQEERLVQEEPSSSKRAYTKLSYTIGQDQA